MSDHARYCKKCGIVVAPYDPTRVKVGDHIYHGKCRTEEVRAQTTTRKPVQTYFRFPQQSTAVH